MMEFFTVDESAILIGRLREAVAERYLVEREIGHGGMANVFLARDLSLDRQVAIKVLKPEIAAAIGPKRFLREIEIASHLTHPHLLPLHDSGEGGGFLYYVMPFVEGETLRERMQREKQLPLPEAVRITCEAASGLSYAHQHGIVHRDIKPENILLQAGQAIIADFGIARAVTASANEPLTTSGLIIGTAQYMSPEQGYGDRTLDGRSDIYSLGCVLYEMLAGEPPFSGPSIQAVVARHASAEIPSVRLVRPGIPIELEEVVNRALAKAPADRFPTAAAFAESLHVVPLSSGHRRRFAIRRRTAVIAASVVVATLGGAFATRAALNGSLREHDWVLVADFEGPPGDQQSADVVRDLVTQALQQSRFVRVVDRRQLNEVMRHAGIPETTFVDVARARELALRSSVRGVLRGGVRRMDSTSYEVVLHVVDADEGLSLASTVGTSRHAALADTVQELVRRLRAQLGERRGAITATRPLRDVATPSLEAYRKYSMALDRVVRHGDIAGSNSLLLQATSLDSGFAAAWAVLGANYVTARQLDSARAAYARALALPDRLSAADGYRLKGDAAYALDRDIPTTLKWYDLYLAEAAHSRSGHSNRALFRSALGNYEAALQDLERAVELNPFGPELIQPTLLNQAAILMVLGRVAEARRVGARLTGPFAEYMGIMIANGTSQWPAAESLAVLAQGSSAAPGVFRMNAVTSHAAALAAQGATGGADTLLRHAAMASRGSTARWYERSRLLLRVVSGSSVRPRADLVPNDSTPAAGMLRAMWAAASGDSSEARAVLAAVDRSSPRVAAPIGDGPLIIDALIAARSRRPRDVIELLGARALAGEHDPVMLDRPDSYLTRWLVGEAYEQIGRADSAALYYSLILRPSNIPPTHFALRGIPFGFAHGKLARLAARGGNDGLAIQHLDALLGAFRRPDGSTVALVDSARATRAELSGARGARQGASR